MASQSAAQDFLRERALAARERHLPQGPIVVFSGPAIWSDWEPLWARLDQIKARVPHMTLVTTGQRKGADAIAAARSEEHTSELQSLMRISYAVFCLKKKNKEKYIKRISIIKKIKIKIKLLKPRT